MPQKRTGHACRWDAEGRVSKVDSGNTWTFTYDAVGDRVAWVSGGTTYDHLFDPAGNWLGVAGSYSIAMLGNRPLTIYNSSETWFHHVNNIASRTFMVNHYGTPTQDMVFYPFGGLWLNWGGGGLEFADLPYRDTTTNTDLTMNRVTSPNLGRWHSPDPIAGNPTNPQSWNMYAYVANNPTTSIDPLGLCSSVGPGGGFDCSPEEAAQSNIWGLGGGGDDIGVDPGGNVFGYNIWDALEGAPGTYLTTDMYGNFNWGFSIDQWKSFYAAQTSAHYYFTGGDGSVVEQQTELNAIQFGQQACKDNDPSAVASCIQQVYDRLIAQGPTGDPQGGNYDFSYVNPDGTLSITINGQGVDPTDFGCAFSRCGVFNSLDYSHGDGTFHIDTANPIFFPVGTFVHVGWDLLGGNTWWSGGIPR